MDNYCNQYTLYEMLKLIDTKITYILNKTRKFLEGSKRNIHYSAAKVKAQSKILYWSTYKNETRESSRY